ncbi:glycosyltransferase [Kitasatospora cinereorecta]|uniref:Glycosyltransferase n=1 Tax=Kitasatospora cinereorecta TaxID=285560 RepID=A0ABW0V6N1_9ACTN
MLVDTTSFRPRALLPAERARVLAQAAIKPGQASSRGLPTLWTKDVQLRPVIIAIPEESELQFLPSLLDGFLKVGPPRLPEHLAPVLVLCPPTGTSQSWPHAGSDVIVASACDLEERQVLLAAADLFLASSAETTRAVHEAMATALPVIGTTGGSLEREITTGGHDANGWLADRGDLDALARAIVQACLYRPERLRRGTAAAEHLRCQARRTTNSQPLGSTPSARPTTDSRRVV